MVSKLILRHFIPVHMFLSRSSTHPSVRLDMSESEGFNSPVRSKCLLYIPNMMHIHRIGFKVWSKITWSWNICDAFNSWHRNKCTNERWQKKLMTIMRNFDVKRTNKEITLARKEFKLQLYDYRTYQCKCRTFQFSCWHQRKMQKFPQFYVSTEIKSRNFYFLRW